VWEGWFVLEGMDWVRGSDDEVEVEYDDCEADCWDCWDCCEVE
jgi:hypothetical protein